MKNNQKTKDQMERTQKRPKMPSYTEDRLCFDPFHFSFTHRGWDRRASEGKGQTYVYLEPKLRLLCLYT